MLPKVSLIIPHRNSVQKLNNLCSLIDSWSMYPDEILIVDSSKEKLNISKELLQFFDNNKISFKVITGEDLFPGKARNLAILASKNSIIAFLDINTIPSNKWLGSSLSILKENDIEGVWGITEYQKNNHTEEIVRASTYGVLPIQTLPGSIFYKNVFHRCGLFIESVRAGEDGDWISRLNLHKVSMGRSTEKLTYVGLSQLSYFSVIKKWHRNYLSASSLPSMKAHKDLYFYVLTALIIIAAFNWNWIMSSWDPNSILYIPNVTKISIASILFIYFCYRGVFLPLKKGVTFNFLFPINFLIIFCLSWVLDVDKVLAFAQSQFKQWTK